jgi:membrane protease YdiL (CAAX protease family)
MSRTAWTFVGLVLALIGPGAIALAWTRLTRGEATVGRDLPWIIAFAALVTAVAAITFFGERLAPADLGFGRMSWISIPSAVALALFLVLVFGPLAHRALAATGLGGFDAGLARLSDLPAWYLALTVIIVAAGEEWLYRGYAVERLAAATGNIWAAGAISLLVFALVHLPLWGLGPSLTTLVSGGLFTALYIWRRDISFLMLAHVATDLYGILAVPKAKA